MSWLEVKVQGLKAEEIPQLVELDQRCLGGIWSLQGYERELTSENSHFVVLKEAIKDKIIGYGCLWAVMEEAHITLLVVDLDYQGKGLGKLLLYNLLKKAGDLKLERATLEVREKNELALGLYQKFGFKIAGKRRNYYHKTGEDALILWYGDIAKPKFAQDLAQWEKAVNESLGANQLCLPTTESQKSS